MLPLLLLTIIALAIFLPLEGFTNRGGLAFWLPPAENTYPRTNDTFEPLNPK